nr:MAG TPA: hypothetical protein [Caudoviricetes sp.]
MKHYYIVVYQSEINDRIMRRITHTSRFCLLRWFNKTPDILLSFTKISKAEAKYLGYKFDKR